MTDDKTETATQVLDAVQQPEFVAKMDPNELDVLVKEGYWEAQRVSYGESLHPAELEEYLHAASGLSPDKRIRRWGGTNEAGMNALKVGDRVFVVRPLKDYFPDADPRDMGKAASQLVVVEGVDGKTGFINPLTAENHTMDAVNNYEQTDAWKVYRVLNKQ